MTMHAAVLTVSDRCAAGVSTDLSGPALVKLLMSHAQQLGLCAPIITDLVPDNHDQIRTKIVDYVRNEVALILTTGGTGFSPRDITPEAAMSVITRRADGLMELARSAGGHPKSYLSRGVAGIAEKSLMITLPGSVNGASEQFAAILPVLAHAIALVRGENHSHPVT